MFLEISNTERENVQKHMGTLYNYLKKEKIQNPKTNSAQFHNKIISILLEAIVYSCQSAEFEYFNEFKKYLLKDVDMGVDYYSYTDGYVLAKNLKKLDMSKIQQISSVIYNNILNLLKRLNVKSKNEYTNLSNHTYQLLGTLLKNYITTLAEDDTDLDNITFSQYLELQVVNAILTNMRNVEAMDGTSGTIVICKIC